MSRDQYSSNNTGARQNVTISSLVGSDNNIVPEPEAIFAKKITRDTVSFADFHRDNNITFNNAHINTADQSFQNLTITEQQQRLSTALGILPEDESYFFAFLVKYNQQIAKLYVKELNAKLAIGDIGYQLDADSRATTISYDPTTHQLKLVQTFTGPFENKVFDGNAEPATTRYDGQIEQSFTFDKETQLFKVNHLKVEGSVAALYSNNTIAPEKFETDLVLSEKLPYLLSLPITLNEKINQLASYMSKSFDNASTHERQDLTSIFSKAVALLKLHDDTYRHNESGLTIPQVAEKLKTAISKSKACAKILNANQQAINVDMQAAEQLRQSSILPIIQYEENKLTSAQKTAAFVTIDDNTSNTPATSEYRDNAKSHLTALGLKSDKTVLHVELTDVSSLPGITDIIKKTKTALTPTEFSNPKDQLFLDHLALCNPLKPLEHMLAEAWQWPDIDGKMSKEAVGRQTRTIPQLIPEYLLTPTLTQLYEAQQKQAENEKNPAVSLKSFHNALERDLEIHNEADRKKVLMIALQNCPGAFHTLQPLLSHGFLRTMGFEILFNQGRDAKPRTTKAIKNNAGGITLSNTATIFVTHTDDTTKESPPITIDMDITFDKDDFDHPYVSKFDMGCDNDFYKTALKPLCANITIDAQGNHRLTSLTPNEINLLQDHLFLDFINNPDSEKSIAIKACFAADTACPGILTGDNFVERFKSANIAINNQEKSAHVAFINGKDFQSLLSIEKALEAYLTSAKDDTDIDRLRHGNELQSVLNAYKTLAQTRPLTTAENKAFYAILADFKNQHVRDTNTWFNRNIVTPLQNYSMKNSTLSRWIARLFKSTFTRNTKNTKLTETLDANVADYDKTATLSAEASIALASELKKRNISALDNSSDNYERILTDRILIKQDLLDNLKQDFTDKLAAANSDTDVFALGEKTRSLLQEALHNKLVDLKHAQPFLDARIKQANLKLFSLPPESRNSPAMTDFNTALDSGKLFTAMKKLFDSGLSQQNVSGLIDGLLTNRPQEIGETVKALLTTPNFDELVKSETLIKEDPRQITMLINRNPTALAQHQNTIDNLMLLEKSDTDAINLLKVSTPFFKAFFENMTVTDATAALIEEVITAPEETAPVPVKPNLSATTEKQPATVSTPPRPSSPSSPRTGGRGPTLFTTHEGSADSTVLTPADKTPGLSAGTKDE